MRTITYAAIIAVLSALPAAAQTMPIFDIETNCRSFGQECIDGEVTSRIYLQQKGWADAAPALRQKCISWEAAWHTKYAPERIAMIRYTMIEGCADGQYERLGKYPQ